jgi:hypothetical protein
LPIAVGASTADIGERRWIVAVAFAERFTTKHASSKHRTTLRQRGLHRLALRNHRAIAIFSGPYIYRYRYGRRLLGAAIFLRLRWSALLARRSRRLRHALVARPPYFSPPLTDPLQSAILPVRSGP